MPGRSYPACEVRGIGQVEQPHTQGVVAVQERSYSTIKIRRGSGEEIPLVQGKEQRLNFAGATMKRYPTSKVRETQVRWQVLQEGIRSRHTETIITEN